MNYSNGHSKHLLVAITATTLLASVLIVSGCVSEEKGEVIITPENDCWAPIMSSVIGIGLSAEYTGGDGVIYDWSSDFGHFLLWNNASEVTGCAKCEGCPCRTGETTWWTYIPENGDIPGENELPDEVHITVTALDSFSGEKMAESGIIFLKTDYEGYCTETA